MKKQDQDSRVPDGEITIESGLGRLDEILSAMESKDTDLSESFTLYEEGMRLLKSVNEKIDTVEKKVMVIRENGLEDFDEGAEDN